MSNSAINYKSVSSLITNAFDNLDEKEKITKFMVDYFKNFIVTFGKPANLSFKDCIDRVSSEFSQIVSNKLSETKEMNNDIRNRIAIWTSSQREFEIIVTKEIKNLI